MALNSSNVPVKKLCPFKEKCYRKNPIHFSEMIHPHLEKIIENQLEGEIHVPEELDFEFSDRSLVLDQLKVLQIVMRRERNKGESSSATKESTSKANSVAAASSSQNLKNKVERHKQATNQKREHKLRTMDEQEEALFKSSNKKSSTNRSTVSAMKNELDDIMIIENNDEVSSQDRKRASIGLDNETETKKSKSSNSKCNASQEYSTNNSSENSANSSSSKTQSIYENFESCNSAKSRREFRDIAIKKMKQQGFEVSLAEPGDFAMKYALSAPYHLFFTRVNRSKATYDQPNSITFPEILDISLGEIVHSLHLNFNVDVGWLCLQYLLAGQSANMCVMYGERLDNEPVGSNIKLVCIEKPSPFGTHHSKLSILKYKNGGIRVVVSTANLYSDDWENRTQGLWFSPHLPPLPEPKLSEGESPTGFKADLYCYLKKYNLSAMEDFVSAVCGADFSSVNVFFLASLPGKHVRPELDTWGHRRLGAILSEHIKVPSNTSQWTLIAQSSSIGSLGPNYESWLQKDIVSSMSRENISSMRSQPNFKFIYPTINNYKQSFDGQVGSSCLPYGMNLHSNQKWIEKYMCQWKASQIARDKAMPHIKSYTRVSPDLKRIPWFVLTSANLSKAAWGRTVKDGLSILNYEAGVVFLPKFIINETTFPIQEEEAGIPIFPMPYDLPLTSYTSDDSPFVADLLYR